jgi:hypothetical protein
MSTTLMPSKELFKDMEFEDDSFVDMEFPDKSIETSTDSIGKKFTDSLY